MRRYLVTIATVLAVHATAAFVSRTYSGFLLGVGGLFVHNTDIASIADRELTGFSLVAGALVLGTIALVYLRGPRKPPSVATVATDSLPTPAIRFDTKMELQRPEFWALHYSEIARTEYRGSSEMIDSVFGIPQERLNDYYMAIYKPEEESYLITVPLVAG